ncbi:Retrovirus-related Pol polyprotein from transposon TNT 1-94 [Eumeta japonica]|uniref:Retrovirus-related Pol polyprotein from transposon TNT 1-94 n=1 Tax=Eumeta variegata TaxID=151549 RepID=A0A4C1XTU3_EUMVA|nr:Retrovirus-related Pol polyprotein from transposon TNT 1-94 [Eumeta japonica]
MYQLDVKCEHAYISYVDEQDVYIWHQCMDYLNFQHLTKIVENTNGAKISKKDDKFTCLTSLEGKQKRLPFKNSESKTTKLLELVHSNICGPMETRSVGGANYFMTFIDDYSKKVFVYFLHKSEALEKFKEFKNQLEKQLECNIKYLRSDNGLEYVNSSFSDFLKSNGIIHQTTSPYTPEQNGGLERMNRTLVQKAKCLLINAKLPKMYWAESIHTAAYVINRSPTRSLKYETPEEIWTRKKPNIHHLKVFGCEAMIHVPKEKRRKWDPKAQKAIFIGYCGYCDHTKGYRFLLPGSRTIIKSKDAMFLESTVKKNYVPVDLTIDSSMHDLSSEPNDTSEISDTNETSQTTNTEYFPESNTSSSSEYSPNQTFKTPPRSNITLRPRNKELFAKFNYEQSYLCCNEDVSVPFNYSEAIASSDSEKWKTSIRKELEAHHQNGTWTLIEKPPNAKLIGSKWEGSGYNETFSPTVRYDSIQLLISIAVQEKLEIFQFIVTTAFLYGQLNENILMTPPEGLDCKPNMVCKLIKSLYGLKQAPSIPADPHVKLQKADDKPKKDHPYQEAVGSLIHAAIVSKPDIMFAVSQGLNYMSESESTDLIGYSDADFANDIETRRSITGYVFLKSGAAVTWSTQRQQTVTLSTTESEFMAVCAATKEAIWLRQLLCDIYTPPPNSTHRRRRSRSIGRDKIVTLTLDGSPQMQPVRGVSSEQVLTV